MEDSSNVNININVIIIVYIMIVQVFNANQSGGTKEEVGDQLFLQRFGPTVRWLLHPIDI